MQNINKKHDNVHYIRKIYKLNYVYNDENKCINDMLTTSHRAFQLSYALYGVLEASILAPIEFIIL